VHVFVTGGSGFIGSNLVDALLADGHHVTVYDNLSTGRREFLEAARAHPAFRMIEADLLDVATLHQSMAGHDAVVHLAANADVRFGWNHPGRDHEQNVVATLNVLEGMRSHGIRRLLFSSTGSVYGECTTIPTPEAAPFPLQTSLYGASKLAAEGFISAYAEAGVISATVFRFVSILGPRYTHGHVIDFVARLTADPTRMKVLGDGTQRKSYLHVSDCVAAIMSRLVENPTNEVLNLGVDGYCEIRDSAAWIAAKMGCEPTLEYTGGDRGWVGDNPFIYLDTTSMRAFGWQPKVSIQAAVEDTVAWLLENQWVLDAAIA
jgi:UDP-glucose 4-epimerase